MGYRLQAAARLLFAFLASLALSMNKMAKSRGIAQETRYKIIFFLEQGFSCTAIAKRVGCSHSAVIKIGKKYKETGSVQDKARSGRPRKSTSRQDRRLI